MWRYLQTIVNFYGKLTHTCRRYFNNVNILREEYDFEYEVILGHRVQYEYQGQYQMKNMYVIKWVNYNKLRILLFVNNISK